jgi:hypothetical protein
MLRPKKFETRNNVKTVKEPMKDKEGHGIKPTNYEGGRKSFVLSNCYFLSALETKQTSV